MIGSALAAAPTMRKIPKKRKELGKDSDGFFDRQIKRQMRKALKKAITTTESTIKIATESKISLPLETAESKSRKLKKARQLRLQEMPDFSFGEYLSKNDSPTCNKRCRRKRRAATADDTTPSPAPKRNGGAPLSALKDNPTPSPTHTAMLSSPVKLNVTELRKVWNKLNFTKCNSILDEGKMTFFPFALLSYLYMYILKSLNSSFKAAFRAETFREETLRSWRFCPSFAKYKLFPKITKVFSPLQT